MVSVKSFLLLVNIFALSCDLVSAQTTTTTLKPTNNTMTSSPKPGECTMEGTFPGQSPGEFYMCRFDSSRNKYIKYSGQCKAEYVKTVFDPQQKKCVLPSGTGSGSTGKN